MIVIGVDTHERSHTLAALHAGTGAARGQLTIPASDDGTLDALRFAGELGAERVGGRGLPTRVRAPDLRAGLIPAFGAHVHPVVCDRSVVRSRGLLESGV
jgi:hypothetical protein